MKIEAKIVADSIFSGARITTVQMTLPRFILAQLNKHRAFSNNAASSRAIPVAKILEQVKDNPVMPVRWGQNQSGMVAEKELPPSKQGKAKQIWLHARDAAEQYAQQLSNLGVHKEITNRILEPFMWSHVVITATEWHNFFHLRLAHDSQPEMQELAKCVKLAMVKSTPVQRDTHLPYLTEGEQSSWAYEAAAMISAARCARVSYLNHDQSEPQMGRDLALAQRLRESKHLTCFEHQAQASVGNQCANLKGWQSLRHYMENLEK